MVVNVGVCNCRRVLTWSCLAVHSCAVRILVMPCQSCVKLLLTPFRISHASLLHRDSGNLLVAQLTSLILSLAYVDSTLVSVAAMFFVSMLQTLHTNHDPLSWWGAITVAQLFFKTKLPSNLRLITRECVHLVTSSYVTKTAVIPFDPP